MSRGTSRTIGADIGGDCALHSSFFPHSDLVTFAMKSWFSVNLLGEPMCGVSSTPSNISPSIHHVTVGFGLPEEEREKTRLESRSRTRREETNLRTPGRLRRGCNLPRRVRPPLSPLAPEHRISQAWMVPLQMGLAGIKKRENEKEIPFSRQNSMCVYSPTRVRFTRKFLVGEFTKSTLHLKIPWSLYVTLVTFNFA